MRKIIVIFASVTLSGCTGAAYPQLVSGNYFMGGDANCKRYNVISSTRIECMDKNGNSMGFRDAMTSQEVQSSQYQRNAEIEALNQSLKQVGQTFEQGGQRLLQQSQGYSAPQAQSYQRPAGVTYRRVGEAIIDSSGRTYRQVGQTLIGSDGTTCSIVGESIYCGVK